MVEPLLYNVRNLTVNKKKIIENIGIVLCGIIFIVCGIIAYTKYTEYKNGINEYSKLDNNIVENNEIIEAEIIEETTYFENNQVLDNTEKMSESKELVISYPDLDIDFDTYKSINDDFVGIIYIPVLDIRYPIAKSKDNTEYLSQTFEKTYNSSGCIFLDKDGSKDLSDINTFIFGHNMKNKTMFGSLHRFRDEIDLCDTDPYIYIYTEDSVIKYQIFAYYLTKPDSITYENITDTNSYNNYIDYALQLSEYSQYNADNFNFTKYPKIITLSTCSDSNHTHYMIVNAVCVGTCLTD